MFNKSNSPLKVGTFEICSTASRNVQLPEIATSKSAGYDFFADETKTFEPGIPNVIYTSIKSDIDNGWYLMLANRSSNPKKLGLVLANGVGVIDGDYYNNEDNEGNIGFAFINITKEPVTITVGSKLGQGVFTPYGIAYNVVPKNTIRKGGFGSTK